MNLQTGLDEIARRQGKSIPPGNVIQGEALPAPALPPGFGGSLHFGSDADPEDLPASDAPIEVRQAPGLNAPRMPATPSDPEIDLSVVSAKGMPCLALCRGQEATLDAQEQAAVARIVLRAVARRVREQLREVEGMLPRRTRFPEKGKRVRKAKA